MAILCLRSHNYIFGIARLFTYHCLCGAAHLPCCTVAIRHLPPPIGGPPVLICHRLRASAQSPSPVCWAALADLPRSTCPLTIADFATSVCHLATTHLPLAVCPCPFALRQRPATICSLAHLLMCPFPIAHMSSLICQRPFAIAHVPSPFRPRLFPR